MRWTFGLKRRRKTHRNFSVRSFAAAAVNRLLAGWKYDGGFTSSEVSSHLDAVRGRSRQMAKDSPHLKRWLDLSAINIVGEGFALKSMPHDGVPGQASYRLDQSAADFIEYHWRRFCTYRDPETGLTWCDATGRKTDAELDRLNVKTLKRDGEYFIHVIRTDANPYGIAWRVLRPDSCDHTYHEPKLSNGNIVHCGVEMIESTRRPVAYYFRTTARNPYSHSNHGQPLVRIPASEIIHGFTQEDEDQPRGIPHCHAFLAKLKMLDELDVAELTAARDEACSIRSYYAPLGSEDEIADLTDDENSDVAQALTQEKEPGQAELLPMGWKQEVHTPQHPNKNHKEFKDGMLRDVASGGGVEYSNFTNNWAGVSFSSVRVGTISERDQWICEQDDFISQCKSPQFLMWLRSFLALRVSGSLPASKYDKFAQHAYRGRRWMWVDPMKDVAAAVIAVDHGWKTNTQVASDMGTDFNDNVDEIEREAKASKGTPLERTAENNPAARAGLILAAVAESDKEISHGKETQAA